MTTPAPTLRRGALLCLVWTAAACSGGSSGPAGGPGDPSGGGPTLSVTVDGVPATTSDVTAATDGPATWVVAAVGPTTLRLRFPAAGSGKLTSAAASGGSVTYVDGSGAVFEAGDGVSGAAYTIDVARSAAGHVAGTFTATVTAGAATRALSGTFDAAAPVAVAGKPYEGRYLGVFEAAYAVCGSTCGPEQRRAFRVVLDLAYSNAEWQAQKYDVTRAVVGDPYFGCTSACSPGAAGSFAYVPLPPGGSSSSAQWIAVALPNGRRLDTEGGYGFMRTSADASVLESGPCDGGTCWTGWQQTPTDWSQGWETTLPAGSQISEQRWWLVKMP